MRRKSIFEAEKECEKTFAMSGKWFHLYTTGKTTELFFKDDEDFRFGFNLLARCTADYPELVIVSFAIMSNHIHIVLSGDIAIIKQFFATYRRRLSRYLTAKYQSPVPDTFQINLKNIADLKTLRNTIVYVNRNGYVVNPDYTPFSYPWSTGISYFNVTTTHEPLANFSFDNQRALVRGRISSRLKNSNISNGHIVADSFCRIKLGMSLFRDAHQYFNLLSKNTESYMDIAVDIDDGEYLTDPELFSEIIKVLNEQYGGAKLISLSNGQKLDIARILRLKYRSSNSQISRILGISQYDINQLFNA